jgi:hypothetical protein
MLGTVMAGTTGASAAPISAAPFTKAVSTGSEAQVELVGHRHHGNRHRHGRRGGRGVGLALGAIGLGLGLSALASRPSYGYYAEPSYSYRPAPWSPAWYDYCSDRYRSFNPRTGYFKGYDGEYHFCR